MNNTQGKLVSIIVPAYNSENSIVECINSATKQTYEDIEIIVVDDGSTDNTKILLEKASYKDRRIKVINIDNHGVSFARNTGIRASLGEWICFLDSDDTMFPDAIETLINIAKKNCSDVVIANYSISSNPDEVHTFLENNEFRVFEGREIINLYKSCIDPHAYGVVSTVTNIGVPWGKLYKADNIRGKHIFLMKGCLTWKICCLI